MKGSELGLTLVELMVVLAIVSIITASLTKMFISMATGHTVRVTSTDLQQSVRAVMDLLSHEIRMAGYSSLSPGSFGVTMAGPQSFSFTVDWDGDGFITESHSGDPLGAQESDLISYRFDGDLYRRRLRVEFVERLRGEVRFTSAEELVRQIGLDVERAREILAAFTAREAGSDER